MRRYGLWAMLAATICSGAWAGEDAAPAAWRRLMTATAPADADIDAVLAACDSDVAKLKALIVADTAYPTFSPGWVKQTLKVVGRKKGYDVAFEVRVPRDYDPAKSYPLVLACHGQYSTGRKMGGMLAYLLQGEAEKYILCAPTMPGPPHFSAEPYQEQAYLAPLAWTR